MIKLLRAVNHPVAFDAFVATVVASADPGSLIGYYLEPAQAQWVRVLTGGELSHPPVHGDLVFEARFFDGRQEWRWHRDGDSCHGAWIAEDPATPPESWTVIEALTVEPLELEHPYLLWGTASKSPTPPGWTAMASARTGPYDLPAVITEKRTARLVAREYAARVDDQGNVAVVEERLLRIDESPRAASDDGAKNAGHSA